MNYSADIDATLLGDIDSLEGPLAQRVYLSVRTAILSLAFPPGSNLRKAPICEQLGVSRAPVSEAITRLASEGLLDVVPQSGTRISYFSMKEIREGAFLREALEVAAIAKVTRDLTDEQQKRLGRNMRLQELLIEDGDVTGFYEADEEFHGLLMEFTGYPRLLNLAQTGSAQVTRARLLLLPTPGRVAETLEEHRAIYAAICDRNERAAQDTMKHHLGQLMPRLEKLAQDRPDLFKQQSRKTKEAG